MHKMEFGQSYLKGILTMIPMKFILIFFLNCILFSMNIGILKELSRNSIQK
jgi:hypothetical protein